MGDSTLDNYHWVMPDQAATVTHQLQLNLGGSGRVINFAIDGFNTKSVLTEAEDPTHPK